MYIIWCTFSGGKGASVPAWRFSCSVQQSCSPSLRGFPSALPSLSVAPRFVRGGSLLWSAGELCLAADSLLCSGAAVVAPGPSRSPLQARNQTTSLSSLLLLLYTVRACLVRIYIERRCVQTSGRLVGVVLSLNGRA